MNISSPKLEFPCVDIQIVQYVVYISYFVVLDCTEWCLQNS